MLKNLLLFALTVAVVSVGVVVLTTGKDVDGLVSKIEGLLSLGSIETGQEYQATSTAESAVYGAEAGSPIVIKTRAGSLGSVVITGAASGIVHFYDATTTDASARTVSATTSLLIATLPASLAAGTYTFDVVFTDGLILDLESGTMPTSTITYR